MTAISFTQDNLYVRCSFVSDYHVYKLVSTKFFVSYLSSIVSHLQLIGLHFNLRHMSEFRYIFIFFPSQIQYPCYVTLFFSTHGYLMLLCKPLFAIHSYFSIILGTYILFLLIEIQKAVYITIILKKQKRCNHVRLFCTSLQNIILHQKLRQRIIAYILPLLCQVNAPCTLLEQAFLL